MNYEPTVYTTVTKKGKAKVLAGDKGDAAQYFYRCKSLEYEGEEIEEERISIGNVEFIPSIETTEMLSIITINDGKEKYQSWKAILDFPRNYDSPGSIFEIEDYGATEDEAVNNLKNNLYILCKLLQKLLYEDKF